MIGLSPENIGNNSGRVLIIDDDSSMVDVLSQMLVEEGYRIDAHTNGIEGLDVFKKHKHEVVLTDLRIGDMTGIDVLRTVKRISPQTAVIILTGYASVESAVDAVRSGANDYLIKPVKLPDLIRSVRNQMSAVRLAARVTELNAAVAEERDKLKRSVAELALLKRLAKRMMSVLSFAEGFEVILNLLIEEVDADVAVIYNIERGTAQLSAQLQPGRNELEQLAEIIRTRGGELLAREVNFRSDDFDGLDASVIKDSGVGLVSYIVVPLFQEERPFGLLVAASRKDREFQNKWSEFIATLSRDASEFLSRIKRSVERLRHFTSLVVEHTLDGIAVIDPVTTEVLLNPVARSMLNLSLGGKSVIADIEMRLNIKIDEIWRELAPREPTTNSEISALSSHPFQTSLQRDLLLKDKTVFYNLNLSWLPSEESNDGLILIVIHDVTRVRSVEAMKKQLISNITHEVRTPTGVIKEFISLILDGVAGDLSDTMRQYIQIMLTNVERLQRLIENLLNLARTDTGGFTVVLKPTQLKPIIEDVVASMEFKLLHKNIKISVEMPPVLPLIYADKDAVTQIMSNLVDNAYKYSDSNSHIKISAMVKGNRLQISTTDEGYGIPQQDFEAIFTRFHRLVDTDDPRFQEGVGLGLALVKDLITRHGGEIWVESQVGVGSTFHFTLQIAAEDEEYKPA